MTYKKGDNPMTQKNIEKLERKARHYPPIPYTRKGKTKQDVLNRMRTKHPDRARQPTHGIYE